MMIDFCDDDDDDDDDGGGGGSDDSGNDNDDDNDVDYDMMVNVFDDNYHDGGVVVEMMMR